MSTPTPIEWARESAHGSGLQSWSWVLAILLALLACALIVWLGKRGGSFAWAKPARFPVRRLGGTRLSHKVSLEVVEFGGQRILLSVSETGAREIARESAVPDTTRRSS